VRGSLGEPSSRERFFQ